MNTRGHKNEKTHDVYRRAALVRLPTSGQTPPYAPNAREAGRREMEKRETERDGPKRSENSNFALERPLSANKQAKLCLSLIHISEPTRPY